MCLLLNQTRQQKQKRNLSCSFVCSCVRRERGGTVVWTMWNLLTGQEIGLARTAGGMEGAIEVSCIGIPVEWGRKLSCNAVLVTGRRI